MKIGERKVLKKPTFIYNGVIILQNSIVEILEIQMEKQNELYTIRYIDKEGNSIIIPNIKKEELE